VEVFRGVPAVLLKDPLCGYQRLNSGRRLGRDGDRGGRKRPGTLFGHNP